MFSLPAEASVVPFTNQPIELDEPAEVIERVLRSLYTARMYESVSASPSLKVLYAAVKFHDKFNIDTGRKSAEEALHLESTKDPFAAFAYASQQGDLALARKAIKLIRFGSEQRGNANLWAMMSDAKPTWQLALAKIVTPIFTYNHDHNYRDYRRYATDGNCSSSHVSLETRCEINMDQVAAKFEPE
jgi:hypothetical protein